MRLNRFTMAGNENISSVGFVRAKDVENNVELYRHSQEAMAMIAQNVPKNTQKAYTARIKEWEVRTNFVFQLNCRIINA